MEYSSLGPDYLNSKSGQTAVLKQSSSTTDLTKTTLTPRPDSAPITLFFLMTLINKIKIQ